MFVLPKVLMGIKRAVTRIESVKRVIAGVAIALGVALAGVPVTEAVAAGTEPSLSMTALEGISASLLLMPPR